MVTDTSDIDRYIDVTALNKLLAQMSSERLENLA